MWVWYGLGCWWLVVDVLFLGGGVVGGGVDVLVCY